MLLVRHSVSFAKHEVVGWEGNERDGGLLRELTVKVWSMVTRGDSAKGVDEKAVWNALGRYLAALENLDACEFSVLL